MTSDFVSASGLARRLDMLFSSTPRGARLARRLAGQWLDTSGFPYGGTAHDTVTLIVAELANNAAQHGRVAGRDFRLGRSERLPVALTPPSDSPTGRGLLLVDALATRWDVLPRVGAPGKTVWAEYDAYDDHTKQ
jgi:hypothetical protein